MKFIDLTQTFDGTMPVYPGDPVPELRCIAGIASSGYVEYQITAGMHVGTHMDAPLHMIEGGTFLSDISLGQFFGRGVLIDARGRKSIDLEILSGVNLERGDIALVMTGFSDRFREPEYYSLFPEFTSELAGAFVEAGVKIVGMDTPSPDRPPYPVHKILLSNQVLILENLTNLASLEELAYFEIVALPAKLQTEAAPTRVVARVVGE